MDFVVTSNQKVKIKESENINKYIDLSNKLKNLWKMKMIVILFIDGVFGALKNRRNGINKKN